MHCQHILFVVGGLFITKYDIRNVIEYYLFSFRSSCRLKFWRQQLRTNHILNPSMGYIPRGNAVTREISRLNKFLICLRMVTRSVSIKCMIFFIVGKKLMNWYIGLYYFWSFYKYKNVITMQLNPLKQYNWHRSSELTETRQPWLQLILNRI